MHSELDFRPVQIITGHVIYNRPYKYWPDENDPCLQNGKIYQFSKEISNKISNLSIVLSNSSSILIIGSFVTFDSSSTVFVSWTKSFWCGRLTEYSVKAQWRLGECLGRQLRAPPAGRSSSKSRRFAPLPSSGAIELGAVEYRWKNLT